MRDEESSNLLQADRPLRNLELPEPLASKRLEDRRAIAAVKRDFALRRRQSEDHTAD